jgi:hypothetical protein
MTAFLHKKSHSQWGFIELLYVSPLLRKVAYPVLEEAGRLYSWCAAGGRLSTSFAVAQLYVDPFSIAEPICIFVM